LGGAAGSQASLWIPVLLLRSSSVFRWFSVEPDLKLVGHRRRWRCGWAVLPGVRRRGGYRCCSCDLPWSSSSVERTLRFSECIGDAGGMSRRWRCYLFLLSGVHLVRSGSASCKRRSSVSVCARALVSFIGLECSHLWLLCFNCCHVLVELYQYKLYHFLISNMQGTILKKII
jgi:hypothetical protein